MTFPIPVLLVWRFSLTFDFLAFCSSSIVAQFEEGLRVVLEELKVHPVERVHPPQQVAADGGEELRAGGVGAAGAVGRSVLVLQADVPIHTGVLHHVLLEKKLEFSNILYFDYFLCLVCVGRLQLDYGVELDQAGGARLGVGRPVGVELGRRLGNVLQELGEGGEEAGATVAAYYAPSAQRLRNVICCWRNRLAFGSHRCLSLSLENILGLKVFAW